MSNDEIRTLLNQADNFGFQLYVKFLCLSYFDNFDIFLTDRQTNRPTEEGDHSSPSPELKNLLQTFFFDFGSKQFENSTPFPFYKSYSEIRWWTLRILMSSFLNDGIVLGKATIVFQAYFST